MGIDLLGPLNVDGRPAPSAPRDRIVLGALALRLGEVVSADRLADAVWGDQPPTSWHKVIQGCVVRLRKLLGPGAIETLPQGYRLTVSGDEIDAGRFERLLGRSRELLVLGEPDRAAYLIGEALALWRGRALADLEGWGPGRAEAARLEELRRDAEELRVDASMRAGRHREVLAEAEGLVAEAPLREHRWALLALAQYQASQQGDALRTLHRARSVLATDLGVDPGPELMALEQAILRHDPSLAPVAVAVESSATCPYPGLVAYGIDDGDLFFGRDADVATCLRRLAESGVVTVIGPSGSGKSSLVRAGIAATLRREGRRVIVITPGPHPMDALTSLPTSGPRPVVVVDQCEEAVTLCHDAGERTRFYSALVEHCAGAPLVIAMRADRVGDASAHPEFARLVERSVHLLSAMDDAQLRAAIEGPAQQAGLLLEPGLVDLLTRDVEREPGALPLLSHALRKAWEKREGHTLTVVGYRESGGIRGSVAQSAEEVYEQTPVEQRRALRDLFLRLAAPNAGGEPVRTRVPRRLVATDPEHEQLVERLVAARLVTSDDGTVELAHEALARAWPRLRGWLDDDTEGQRIRQHLTVAANTWDDMARPESELYRGVRLAQALDWRDRGRPDLTATEQAFLDSSWNVAEVERATAEARAHHQVRVNRRLRTLLVGIAVLLVIALVAGGIAIDQRGDARDQARVADSVRLAAQASSQPTEQRSLALLLALEARRLDTSDATDGALQATLAAVPPGVERLLPVGGLNGVAAVSPDQRLLAAPVDDGDIRLIDFATGRTLHVLHGSDAGLLNVTAFSPNSRLLVSGGRDARIRLWDSRTGRLVGEPIDGGSGTVWGFFAPTDPTTLFTVNSSSVTRWDVSRPDHPVRVGGAFEFQEEPTEIVSVRTSLDGRRVAAGGWTARRAVVWDVETETRLGEYDGLPGAFTADGNSLVVAREDHLAFVDVNTGAEQGDRLTGLTTANPNLVTNAEGTRIAVADLTTSSIRVFDATTRKQVGETLELFKGVSFPAAFLDRDRLVVAGGRSQQAAVWRFAEPTPPLATVLSGRTGRVDAYFTPNSEEIVTSGYDDTWADRWRASDGRHIGEVTIDGTRTGLPMFSRDGDVAVGRPDGSVDVFDARTGRAISTFDTGQPAPRPSWSPDGSVLATVANDLSIVLWDVADRRHPRERARLRVGTPADEQQIMAVFSPDGDLVAASHWRNAPVAFRDPGSAIIDVADGRILRKVDGGGLVAFSPDGRTLVTSNTGAADLVGRFDVATGERRWLRAFPTFVFGVAFADGGARVATVRFPGGVAFGSVTPTGPPIAAAFAPAVIVELWDAATARPIGEPMIVRGYSPTPARANEDGTKLVNGTQNGVAILWDLDSGHWTDIACRIAGRNLTRAEWTQYLPDREYAATCPQYPGE